nr:LPXTG cell wall anchor domain-containing protein [Lactococcus garvieae]
MHYLYENKTEALPSYVANPLLFSRAIITDNVTGDKTFGEWKAEQENEFNEVKSPDVKGYTPDQKLIEKIEGITAETQDITKSVIYKRNQGQIIITYIDDTTGKTLDIDELSGLTDDNTDYTTLDKISLYEKMGDNLVSNDFPTDGTKFKDNEQYYVVHLSHGVKTVVEEKKVNQTIHYVYKDGSKAVSDFNAIPKLFTRAIIIDKVTGEKTIGKWTAKMGNSFDKILSPIIKGYKPDKLLIPEVKNITEDTEDIEDTVTYSKNTPDDDTVPITTPPGDDMVPPITPRGIIIPPVTPPNNLIINNKNNSKKVINWTDLSNDRLLPSTGDDQKSQKYLGVLGSLLLGISAILIFMKRKNK